MVFHQVLLICLRGHHFQPKCQDPSRLGGVYEGFFRMLAMIPEPRYLRRRRARSREYQVWNCSAGINGAQLNSAGPSFR